MAISNSSSMSAPNSVVVPVVTVQPTASEIIEEVNDGVVPIDKFWVSCYKTSEPSIHTKIHVELDQQDRNLVRLSPEDTSLDFELLGGGRHVRPGKDGLQSAYDPENRVIASRPQHWAFRTSKC